MSKKIYFKEIKTVEVMMDEVFHYHDMKVKITQWLIDNNPLFFTVEETYKTNYVKLLPGWSVDDEFVGSVFDIKLDFQTQFNDFKDISPDWDWEYILNDAVHQAAFDYITKDEYNKKIIWDKAKKDYPIGTKFMDYVNFIETVNNSIIAQETNGNICINTIRGGAYVYYNNEWAKKYVFTTEDNVDIYEGDNYWYIDNNHIIRPAHTPTINFWNKHNNIKNNFKRFSTEQAAKEYCNIKHPFNEFDVIVKWYCGRQTKETVVDELGGCYFFDAGKHGSYYAPKGCCTKT